jgi:Bifunctional DNA primase/polymerase, N-terminal
MSTAATALRLREQKLHVFPADHPVHPECIGKHGPDNPCDGSRGKHPAVKWGTWAVAETPQMIEQVWERYGGVSNVAVACGPSNLVILDEGRRRRA